MSQVVRIWRPKLHLKYREVCRGFTDPSGPRSRLYSPGRRGLASLWPILPLKTLQRQGERGIRVWKRLYVAAAALPQRPSFFRIMGSSRRRAASRNTLTNPVQIEAFVTRAKGFGIASMMQLLIQSDVAKTERRVPLFIRQPYYEKNAGLWCLLLEFRHALDGDSGVRGVWSVMKDRMGGQEAFHNGPTADRIWAILLSSAIRSANNQSFLRSLCDIESRNGALRSDLYVEIVGSLLDIDQPAAACEFSLILQRKHSVQRQQLLHLFNRACVSTVSGALGHFCMIYGTVPNTHLYEPVISQLCNADRVSDALTMHKAMLAVGDVPTTFEQIKPLIKILGRKRASTHDLLHDLKAHGIGFEGQIQELLDHQNSLRYGIARGTLNVVTSTTFGRQPTRLGDKFVARAFATSAFSFDFILSGLRLLGLREIGPQALRQIGLQSANSQELRNRLATLANNGVDTGSSIFTRVVIQCVERGQDALLRDVLESDQHSDVFEDSEIQKRLLRQYYHRQDWRQIDRTLAVLSVAFPRQTGFDSDILRHNLVLKSAVEQKDWVRVRRLMAHGRAHGWACGRYTIKRMYHSILGERAPGVRDLPKGSLAELHLLIELWQEAIHGKTFIPPAYWREPLRRLGILGQWADLVEILPWLALHYGRRYWSHERPGLADGSDGRVPAKRSIANLLSSSQALAAIFFAPLQRAVVEWPFLLSQKTRRGGQSLRFRSRTHSPFAGSREIRGKECLPIQTTPPFNGSKAEDSAPVWTEGVRLLRLLHEQHGVSLSKEDIRMACLNRLRELFSNNSWSRRSLNMNIRKNNSTKLRTYLWELEEAWGGLDGPLFPKIRDAYRYARRPKQLTPRDFRQPQNSADLRSSARNVPTLPLEHFPRRSPRQTDASQENSMANTKGTASSEKEQADPADQVVMYRDLFTASNTDYEQNAKP